MNNTIGAYALGLILGLLMWVPVHAQSPTGCWIGAEGAVVLSSTGTYLFRGKEGRWMTQGNELWMLNPKRMGIKWRFTLSDETLVFDRPEDFEYLGRTRYRYFQMTPPTLTYRFDAMHGPNERLCQAAAARNSVLSIKELRATAPTSGVWLLEGTVSKKFVCPPCPEGAKCKPCMGNNVVLSIDDRRHQGYDTLNDGDLILFGDGIVALELGTRYVVLVEVLDQRQSQRGMNDLALRHVIGATTK